MATINIITPKLDKEKFSGGVLCLLEHAHQLHKKGHDVCVIPIMPSPYPNWFEKDIGQFSSKTKKILLRQLIKSLFELVQTIFIFNNQKLNSKIGIFIENLLLIMPGIVSDTVKISLKIIYLKQMMRKADITIATSFETALAVSLTGSGKLYYFMQHYEAYFKNEYRYPWLAEKEAMLSYYLNLQMIANSIWLQDKLFHEYGARTISYCPNAINHEIFQVNEKRIKPSKNEITIISYGGRGAKWKGFEEMAMAIAIARKSLTDINIIWQVYGDAALAADNAIACYQHLGFLKQKALAQAYQQADILLSASWYESFPLFPLEAMACGLATISTQPGTEAFCRHGETAEVPSSCDPQIIAESIIRLITNQDYREKIAINGHHEAKKFTWDNAGKIMEKSLEL